jgi:parallel beta-helix repeat protein
MVDGAFSSTASYSKLTSTINGKFAEGGYCGGIYLSNPGSNPTGFTNYYVVWLSEDDNIGHAAKIESITWNAANSNYKYTFVNSTRPGYYDVSGGQRVVLLRRPAINIDISDNIVRDCDNQGIYLYGAGIGCDIYDNRVIRCGQTKSDRGIDLIYLYGGQPSGEYGPVFHNTVNNNTLTDCDLVLRTHSYGGCPDSTLRPSGNTQSGNTMNGTASIIWANQYTP